MIDTHCHMVDSAFDEDRDSVLARAQEVGVHAIVVMGETFDENRRVLELCEGIPLLHACVGHYPEHLDREMAKKTVSLARENRDRIRGLGEVGLDYRLYEDEKDRERQREILADFASLSNELDLPLSVHSRSAGHYTIDWLASCKARKVVMHAFDGKASHAKRGLEHGFYFSIPPSLSRSRQKEKLVKAIPLSRLLLESDAPVLGPEPGTRNEPANVKIAAEGIASIKGVSLEEVIAQTDENARRLFFPEELS